MRLDARAFLQDGNFAHDWKEADLQNYLIHYYTRHGWNVRDEVTNRFGRADLVINNGSDKYVIEIKKWLTRDNLLQAKGQVEGYAVCLAQEENRSATPLNKIIMGLLPTDQREQEAAIFQAERNKIMGVDVIFIDQHPKYYKSEWNAGYRAHYTEEYTQEEYVQSSYSGKRKPKTLGGAIWGAIKDWYDNVEIIIDFGAIMKGVAIAARPIVWFVRITLDIAGIKSSRRRPRNQREKFLASCILYFLFAVVIINMPALAKLAEGFAAGFQAFTQIISQVIK